MQGHVTFLMSISISTILTRQATLKRRSRLLMQGLMKKGLLCPSNARSRLLMQGQVCLNYSKLQLKLQRYLPGKQHRQEKRKGKQCNSSVARTRRPKPRLNSRAGRAWDHTHTYTHARTPEKRDSGRTGQAPFPARTAHELEKCWATCCAHPCAPTRAGRFWRS